MTKHLDAFDADREDRIRALAYRLWEEEGQPEGMAEEHWRRAAEIVDAEDAENETSARPGWLKKSSEPSARKSGSNSGEEGSASGSPSKASGQNPRSRSAIR